MLFGLILFIVLFIFLLYMQIKINSSINIILLNSNQLKNRQNVLYDKLIKSGSSVHEHVESLSSQVEALRKTTNLLENAMIKMEIKINQDETKIAQSIDEFLKREDIVYENQKLKRILKRQNRAQPPR